jgi:hypothetical protein
MPQNKNKNTPPYSGYKVVEGFAYPYHGESGVKYSPSKGSKKNSIVDNLTGFFGLRKPSRTQRLRRGRPRTQRRGIARSRTQRRY